MHPASSGTFVDAAGQSRHLKKNDIKIDILDTWKSRLSQARYPSRWRLRIKPLSIDVTIRPNLSDQEMRTVASTGVVYWEGSVSIGGKKEGRPVKGEGYVELTGYAADLDAPM